MHNQKPLGAIILRLLVLLCGLPYAYPTYSNISSIAYPNITSIASSKTIPFKTNLARKHNFAPGGQLVTFQDRFLSDSSGRSSIARRLESPRTGHLINLDRSPGFQQHRPDLYKHTTNQSLLTQRRRTNENLVQPWNSNGAITLVTWTENPTNQKHAWSNPNKTPHEHRGTQLRHER